ncbi:unnamed protein product [Calicophoron daubneyi]|uniref:Tetraspanin n=1 Tax=Calicophoron daubneyi TaxID=300641 RepID=A0AAV2TNU0_CALDB
MGLLKAIGISMTVVGFHMMKSLKFYSEYSNVDWHGTASCFIFIGIGLIIVSSVATLVCCILCPCCMLSPCCAVIFVILKALLALAIFIAAITCAVMASNRAKNMDHLMNKAMDNYVINYYKNESCRERMDMVQNELRCCGSNSSADYKGNIPKSCHGKGTKDSKLLGCTTAVKEHLFTQFHKMYIWSMVVIFLDILICASTWGTRKIVERNERQRT